MKCACNQDTKELCAWHVERAKEYAQEAVRVANQQAHATTQPGPFHVLLDGRRVGYRGHLDFLFVVGEGIGQTNKEATDNAHMVANALNLLAKRQAEAPVSY